MKGQAYDLEFYLNNTASNQYYTRNDVQYTLIGRAMHIWAGDTQLEGDEGKNIITNTTNIDLAVGQPLNGLAFQSTSVNNTDGPHNIYLSNITAQFPTIQTVLPVSLSRFTAKKVNNAVNLTWTTSSESNNSHFEILHSVNGIDFKVLGKVSGAGNSNKILNYLYTDYNPAQGVNYYKLRQVDRDATSTETKVLAVKMGLKEENLYVFSDAAGSGYALISSTAPASGQLRVSDIMGKVLFAENVRVESGSTQFSLPVLPSGIYVVSFGTYSAKFVK